MKSKIAIEKMKRDARFSIGLDQDQTNLLVAQVEPISSAIESLIAEKKRIRADSRLSNAGKADDIQRANNGAVDKIIQHAAKLSREAVIADMQQRIATKVAGSRERARQQMQDAPLLAQELRQSVLPKMVKQGEAMQIPASRTVEKMAMRAAENYAVNPAKSELIINALSLGQPFCPDLPEGALAQINNTIAAQIAPLEQTALNEAEAVQSLIDFVTGEALQSIKEMA